MNSQTPTLTSILTKKKEFLRLFLIAAVLAFAVGNLSGLATTSLGLPTWATLGSSLAILAGCFALLAADLRQGLIFEDSFEAVIFLAPDSEVPVKVEGYDFSFYMSQVLSAIQTENRSIFSEWTEEPLVGPKTERPKVHADAADPDEKTNAKDKRNYIGIYKVDVEESTNRPAKSTQLLEEAASFVVLEELSTHLSSYFEGKEEDQFITELKREDIPAVLLQNRILNLLSTPIEQRDIFLEAFPNKEDRPKGILCSLWGSDGSMYSRFDLVVPKNTELQYPRNGFFLLRTPRLELSIAARYLGISAVVSDAFIAKYMRLDPRSVQCRKVNITLSCKISPRSLLTSAGWDYYRWVDSFRETLRTKVDFDAFQRSIHWQVIEPLLFSMRPVTPRRAEKDDV